MDDYYFEKLKNSIKGRVYIFIDAANLERSVQDMYVLLKDIPNDLKKYYPGDLCYRMDYKKFVQVFEKAGDIERIIFYSANFKTKSHNNFLAFLKKELDFKLKTKFIKEFEDHTEENPHRKANFDVEIAVDATYELKNYETFILFSGDSDFEYLLEFLRGQNKITIVFSRSGHVAKELPPASTYYFDILDFRKDYLRIIPKAKKSRSKRDPAVDNG